MKPIKKYMVVVERDIDNVRVIEKPTGLVVDQGNFTSSYEDVKETARRLNGGNGFNGYTPPFFLNTCGLLT